MKLKCTNLELLGSTSGTLQLLGRMNKNEMYFNFSLSYWEKNCREMTI